MSYRWILAPLSVLYWIPLRIRHWLYDKALLPSMSVPIPTICVGNLAVGGTGKTPHTEYLIRLLSKQYTVAVLSRGYKRKTHGFVLADQNSTASTIGDESMQIHRKFPDIAVAVCESRVHGVNQLRKLKPEVQVIILDDAMQHRALQCGHTILLTAHDNLYIDDHLLPWGWLRDWKQRSLAAQTVIITKCPDTMRPIDKRVIDNRLHLPAYQQLYFSHIVYEPLPEGITHPLLICGIANPDSLIAHIRKSCKKVEIMTFPDHHRFSKADQQRMLSVSQKCDCVLTTEKDYERLLLTDIPNILADKLRVVPISVQLGKEEEAFQRQILSYVSRTLKHLPKNNKV